jgi:hypothetical protein
MQLKLLILMALSTLASFGQKVTFRPVETIIALLNSDTVLDTISLSSSFDGFLEAYKFDKLTIHLSGSKNIFIARKFWTQIDTDFLKTNKNLLSSSRIFSKKNGEQTVILLFGKLYGAGGRNEFSIINIMDNKAKMVFDRLGNETNVGLPITLADLDSNGTLDFVYTHFRESIPIFKTDLPPGDHKAWENGTFSMYCPFWVHTVDSACSLNKKLTVSYNERHYVFAGFEHSSKIAVYKPANNGKIRACKRGSKGELIWLTE